MERLVIAGAVDRGRVPGLVAELRGLLPYSDKTVPCDVRAISAPDAATVDALACLQLHSKRLGRCLQLEGVAPHLSRLIALMGLSDVLAVEMRGQPEQREEVFGVEEEIDP